jgi:hypothetical protein
MSEVENQKIIAKNIRNARVPTNDLREEIVKCDLKNRAGVERSKTEDPPLQALLNQFFLFFFFWQYCGLDSGLCIC